MLHIGDKIVHENIFGFAWVFMIFMDFVSFALFLGYF